jgi:hypothetical protein
MKKNWIQKIIMGLSFTSVLFVFQACYGTPQDFGADMLVEGIVQAKQSGEPISGIKVTLDLPEQGKQYAYTNEEGRFSMYTLPCDSLPVCFTDSVGKFASIDTVIVSKSDRFFVTIELEKSK